MGVQQFLGKVLPTAGREIDLRHYADRGGGRPLRVAVDIASVVYKATQGFGDMLADERHLDSYGRAELLREQQQPTAGTVAAPLRPEYEPKVQKYVQKCTKFVVDYLEQFRNAGMDILVVLDGSTPPIKINQVKKRNNKRKQAAAARDAAVDNNDVSLEARLAGFRQAGAGKYFHLVIDGIISSLRASRISFLVAPYESDGQLAFLSEKRYVDLIVTEDSDLMACGASPVLYKTSIKRRGVSDDDQQEGIVGQLLRKEDLSCATDLDLMDYSSAMLATVFIAAGSDYCEKLKGIGIVTACDAARKAFHANPKKVNNRAPLDLFFEQLYKATYAKDLSDNFKRNYEEQFLGALLMFRHPLVFNPVTGQCETFRLNNPDPELMLYEPYAALVKDDEARAKFVGQPIPSPLACYVAEGWLDPRSKQKRRFTRLPDHVDTCYKEWRKELDSEKQAQQSFDEQSTGKKEKKKPPVPSFHEADDATNKRSKGEGATKEAAISLDSDNSDMDDVNDEIKPDVPNSSLSDIQHILRQGLRKTRTTANNQSQTQPQFETQQVMEE